MSEPDLSKLLAKIGGVNDLLLENPATAEVLRKLQEGEVELDEGVRLLAQLIEEEGLMPQLQKAAEEVGKLAPGYELDPNVLQKAKRPVMMRTSTGQPQLNPLYEAALIERASLDGDAPELRYGPLPRGGKPAVPVLTEAMDPVVVGMMLSTASERISLKIEDAMEDHVHLIGRVLEETEAAAKSEGVDVTTALEIAKRNLPEAPTGVEGYLAGEPPPLMKVESPGIDEILALTPTERQECAYRALATTQGRVSLAHPIQNQILQALRRKGLVNVEVGTPADDGKIEVCWRVQIWGARDVADNFSFPHVATAVLTRDLMKNFEESDLDPEGPLQLEVVPYNGISERQFGWVARLGRF